MLCISGDPVALWPVGHEATYAVAAALLAYALILRDGGNAVRAFVPMAAVFATLSVVHAYAFDFFPIVTDLGFLTRLFIGMATVILVSDFVLAYVTVLSGLSLLSFIFWVPEFITSRSGTPFHLAFVSLANRLGPQPDGRWSLGFHTYILNPQDMHRNAGIFWEPGAFAGYIIVALLMLAALRPSLTRRRHLAALCVLSLALVSTFSTTGYIAFPIALLLNLDWHGVGRSANAELSACVILPLLIVGSLYVFSQLDFLQTKVRNQITAVERQEPGWQLYRVGTLVFDWEYISRRPITGWGLNQRTRFALHPWMTGEGLGNGMSDFIAKFGVIGFGTFLIGLVRGAKHIGGKSPGYILGFLTTILVVLQGEAFLGFPCFLGLMFLGHASVRGQRLRKVRFIGADSPTKVRYHYRLESAEE
jgi:hypothetical protein